MKKLIPFIILIFSLFLLNSCVKANDNVGHDGRCTGSAPCSACTTCSRCGHCGAGGTCGACSRSSPRRSSSSESSSKRRKSKKHKISESRQSSKSKSNKPPKVFIDEVNINADKRSIATVSFIKIYEKASLQSTVIEKVSKTTKLIPVSKQKYWQKVKVQKSGKTGYVYYKDIK